MFIGQAARTTGASAKAIHLYEQLGLMPIPARQGQYRFYDALSIDMLRCIRQAQSLGFSLKDIRNLVDTQQVFMTDQFEQATHVKLTSYQAQIRQAEQQIKALTALRAEVTQPDFCEPPNSAATLAA
jgi:MerR family transcriptional regulator, copper efflux regulator